MAKGNAQQLSDLIDDTNKSRHTTFSSEHIQDLINASGAEETVYLLTVSDTAPDIFQENDKYYSTNTKLIYTATSPTDFNNGENPKKNILYIDQKHNTILVWNGTKMTSYGGGGSTTNISDESNNAIEQKDDGIYVKDLSSDVLDLDNKVNNINIAQKTVNELGFEELLSTPYSFTAPLNNSNASLKKTVTLDKPVTDYNFLDFYITSDNTGAQSMTQHVRINVADIIFNNLDNEGANYKAVFRLFYNLNSTVAIGGSVGIVIKAWFKDPTHIYLFSSCNPQQNFWSNMIIEHVYGIKKEIITIDPINYLEDAGSIEGIPVGTEITTIGKINPPRYLAEDGTEYNIADYPELAQAIKDGYGVFNFFGGDGITTFKVPYDEHTAISCANGESITDWYSPSYTSASDSVAFTTKPKLSVSGRYDTTDNYAPWKAFNRLFGTSQSSSGTTGFGFPPINGVSTDPDLFNTADNWLQLEFKDLKTFDGFRIQARPSYEKEMASQFKIWVSMDGKEWDCVHIQSTKLTSTVPLKDTWYEVSHKPAIGRFWRISNCACWSTYNGTSYHTWIEEAEIKLSDNVILPCKYIKATKDVMVKSINGYEQIDELLPTPVIIQCPLKTDLTVITSDNNSIAYGIKSLAQEITLSKSYEDFDELEIVAWGLNRTDAERFNKLAYRIRREDMVFSDKTYFDDGSIDLTFDAISSGLRKMQLRFNLKPDKKTLTLVQIAYYHGPTLLAGITPWYGVMIEEVRGIKTNYTIGN